MNSTVRLLLKQFTSPIVLILIAATVVSMFVGDVTDGIIILAIILPSGLLSFWQEYRAGETMKTLLARVQVHVEVLRNGVEQTIPIAQLKVGDQVILRLGDIVPGDLRLTSSNGLQIDESALTGESFAVEKQAGDSALLGTHVAAGTATGVVEKLGRETEYGALAEAVAKRAKATSFERGITRFGVMLMWAMLVLLAGLFIVNIALQKPLIDSLLFSIALAVGLTPQLLPAIISVSLSAGAKALAKSKVLVKRLDAIEDFGSMNVLCTDKTGTITAGVVRLDGAIDLNGQASNRVSQLAFLNAKLQQGFKNPLDEAILAAGEGKLGNAKLLSEIAYDFERKMLSVLVQDGKTQTLITKGAFENVLEVCSLTAKDRRLATELFEKYSAQGNRVIAVATGSTGIEKNLKLEGFLLFMDPPKPGAAEAIAELEGLGIELYLLTGDNALAAKSIAGQVGLPNEKAITGTELAKLSDAQLRKALTTCRIFAAVDPLQKQRIVTVLKSAKNTVGFFGDGINDAAALHVADVGISVDTSVDIAKHTAAIVLLDKNLQVIADGVRLGRKTFINSMKYIRVTISANFGNMLSMAAASAFLPFLPLLPIQILLLNFMSDFPALAISSDSVDPESVEKPKSWNLKSIRNFMLMFGLISSAFDIFTFMILSLGFKADAELFRSGWFVESTLTELTVMLVLRTRRKFWQSRPGKALWISSLAVAIAVIAIPFTALGALLQLEPLPLPLLLALLALIAVYALINERAKKRWLKD